MSSHAYSAKTQEIINRKNRTLQSPSKDITAYQEDAVARYNSESRRLSGNRTDIEGVDNPDPTSESAKKKAEEEKDTEDSEGSKKVKHRSAFDFSGDRTFAVGFVGGSSYGIFGLDFEMGVNDSWAFGGGLGTGMSYSTWDLHGKYYFNSTSKVNPYAQFGYANWNMRRVSRTGEKGRPEYLTDRFFSDKDGNITHAQSRHLVYPGLGVLFLDKSGLGASAQIVYLISLNNSAGALYGGVGLHLYF